MRSTPPYKAMTGTASWTTAATVMAHLALESDEEKPEIAAVNQVDGKAVPVPHFGAILPPADWQALADKLKAAGTDFVIEPHTRFVGEPDEQSTMFFLDPYGNALEFKLSAMLIRCSPVRRFRMQGFSYYWDSIQKSASALPVITDDLILEAEGRLLTQLRHFLSRGNEQIVNAELL